MDGKVYREDDRARIRSSLSNEQHHYVIALENVAIAARHVLSTTPHTPGSKLTALAAECLNDLYNTLVEVDFMDGDVSRDDD